MSACVGTLPVPGGSTFSAWDYVVFGVILVISACIGLYYAFSGGRQRTTMEFLLADKSMSAFPVALSVFASFFSASTLLGTPAEVYMQGTMYWMCVWGAMMTPLLGAFLFGPFLHRLKIISVFEYLEMRFQSKSVRLLGAFLFIIKLMLGMGIVMYGPATALTEVTGIPVWAAILSIGLVCGFYTTIGGMKAVIWTDVFQTAIMIAGLLSVIIQGCIETGGIENAWRMAEAGGRIEFFDFNPDPTVRHTFWTLVVGNFFVWLPPYSIDQQMIQRYASTKSLKHATIALLINIPGIFFMISLCCLLGVIMYGYYATMKCDPLKSGRVSDPNQLVPRFVMDIFDFAPGLPGLFVASLFSGALSSVSSMLNSLAAVVWEDIFKMFGRARKASDRTATIVTKLLAVFFAGVGIGMAFLFSLVGGTVLQMSLAFNGAAGAPMVGLFILGAFLPWSNWIGALAGGILGFAFPMWISIGAYVEKPPVMKEMYYSLECCNATSDNTNSSYFFSTSSDLYTTTTTTPSTTKPPEAEGIVQLYTLSYLWYTALGILTTVVIGTLVSFLTGYTKPKTINPKLLIPYVDKFWCCFPESCRVRFRCGIDYSKADESESDSSSETEIPIKFPDFTPAETRQNDVAKGSQPCPDPHDWKLSSLSDHENKDSADNTKPIHDSTSRKSLNTGEDIITSACSNSAYINSEELDISRL